MKIQFASDLHLEFITQSKNGYIGIDPAPDADVLVLAGDVDNGVAAIDFFKSWPVPVIYVYGNHDFYGCVDINERLAEMRDACMGTQINFLEKDAVIINGVRFLGTTLWTDYLLFGRDLRKTVMNYCGQTINDHCQIRVKGIGVTPAQLLTMHEKSVAWLADQLASPFRGKTVVVTHHAPHLMSLPDWDKSAYVKAAYASDMTELMDLSALWLHGHVHVSRDYWVGNTRIAANPRGYPRRKQDATTGDMYFQNCEFNSQTIIDLDLAI